LAARTARAAVRIFADTYQLALSCLTLGQFNVEGYLPIDVPYRGDLQRGRSVRLSNVELDIIVVLRYRIILDRSASWAVRVVGYHYELQHRDGRELIAYHTHPEGAGPVIWPHLHLGPAMGELWRPATRAHLPTGDITIQDVIRLAIREFHATPRRDDWEAVLRRTRDTLEALSS
jgi:hypothetical protein